MMGGESRTGDGRNLDLCGRGGGGGGRGGGIPDAAGEAADEGICVAENVSGVRVDYAASEFGLPGVWEGDGGGAVVFFVGSWRAAGFWLARIVCLEGPSVGGSAPSFGIADLYPFGTFRADQG